MLSVATEAPTSFGAADATSRKAAKRPLRTQPVVTIMPLLIEGLPSPFRASAPAGESAIASSASPFYLHIKIFPELS